MRFAPLLLLLGIACAGAPRDLADGQQAPDEKATLVMNIDFTGFGLEPEVAFIGPGGKSLVLRRKPGLFAVPVPPGDYRLDYVHFHRVRNEPVRFTARAGEVVYLGTWRAVLGPDIEVRDEGDAALAELERRFGIKEIQRLYPGGRKILLQMDPRLSWQFNRS